MAVERADIRQASLEALWPSEPKDSSPLSIARVQARQRELKRVQALDGLLSNLTQERLFSGVPGEEEILDILYAVREIINARVSPGQAAAQAFVRDIYVVRISDQPVMLSLYPQGHAAPGSFADTVFRCLDRLKELKAIDASNPPDPKRTGEIESLAEEALSYQSNLAGDYVTASDIVGLALRGLRSLAELKSRGVSPDPVLLQEAIQYLQWCQYPPERIPEAATAAVLLVGDSQPLLAQVVLYNHYALHSEQSQFLAIYLLNCRDQPRFSLLSDTVSPGFAKTFKFIGQHVAEHAWFTRGDHNIWVFTDEVVLNHDFHKETTITGTSKAMHLISPLVYGRDCAGGISTIMGSLAGWEDDDAIRAVLGTLASVYMQLTSEMVKEQANIERRQREQANYAQTRETLQDKEAQEIERAGTEEYSRLRAAWPRGTRARRAFLKETQLTLQAEEGIFAKAQRMAVVEGLSRREWLAKQRAIFAACRRFLEEAGSEVDKLASSIPPPGPKGGMVLDTDSSIKTVTQGKGTVLSAGEALDFLRNPNFAGLGFVLTDVCLTR
jgi:hypothetical protein